MKVFAQLTKVDEEKRLVYGRAAQEVVDHSGEVMDYMASKPHFEKWSADVSTDTGGKSLGNLRAMHGKVAAGKLTGIEFDDVAKAIDVVAKVVDDNEWKKVLEGVYTGFSIGGSYGQVKVEKVAGRDIKRYTALPTELSLVDRPCMPTAKFFQVQKADGTLAKVDFQATEPPVEDTQVDGTPEQLAQMGKLMNEHGLNLGDMVEKVIPAFLESKDKEEGGEKKPKAEGDADGDEGGEGTSDEDGDEEKVEKAFTKALAAVAAYEALAKAAPEGSLAKVEGGETPRDPLMDLLKVGMRNNKSDQSRIEKVHALAVELGAGCAPIAKALEGGDLQKALDAALEPLQKQLNEAKEQITKLASQPAPARISLRAITKAQDSVEEHHEPQAQLHKAVVDAGGEVHEAASIIRALHKSGGAPLAMLPSSLNK